MLSAMNLNYEGIRYYAGSVIKAKIFQLNQRSDEDRYVHVTAFIAHQYYRLQDNLVDVMLSVVQSFQNSARRSIRNRVTNSRARVTNRYRDCCEDSIVMFLIFCGKLAGSPTMTGLMTVKN